MLIVLNFVIANIATSYVYPTHFLHIEDKCVKTNKLSFQKYGSSDGRVNEKEF